MKPTHVDSTGKPLSTLLSDFDGLAKTDTPPVEGLEELVPRFLGDRKTETLNLLNSNKLDLSEVRGLAHKWKGFSEPYGFKALSDYAKEIETAAQEGNRESCQLLLGQVYEYLMAKQRVIGLDQ